MKRSEMLTLLSDLIQKTKCFTHNEQAAVMVLREIEEAGMLPPKREIEYNPLPSKKAIAISNTWEPEE